MGVRLNRFSVLSDTVVIVLDWLSSPAERGRRRPRGRSGKIPPLLYRARPRRRARLLCPPGGSRTTTTTSTIRKNPATYFSCCPRRRARPRQSCSIARSRRARLAFLTGRASDDHEHDQGKFPPLLYRARLRRRARLLSSPGRPRTSTITWATRETPTIDIRINKMFYLFNGSPFRPRKTRCLLRRTRFCCLDCRFS